MTPYGWKPRANEYVGGGGVERLERVVSRHWARRQAVLEVDEQAVERTLSTPVKKALDENQVRDILTRIRRGERHATIAARHGVCTRTIGDVKKRALVS